MNSRKKQTRLALEMALSELLKVSSFDAITTTQLAEKANISRSGFYTHYKDKYEMIDHYQRRLFNQVEYIFDKHSENSHGAILEIFEFLNREPLFAGLLSKNGTREIQEYIKNKFRLVLSNDLQAGFSKIVQDRFREKNLTAIEIDYGTIYLVNALFGVCQMWIERGKKENPEQMTALIFKMMT